MDINQLEVLVVVARERVSRGRQRFYNEHSRQLSQAIRRLEQDVGEKLFDRSSKDGTLTYAGELLVDYARQMLNLRQTAQTAIKEMRNLHSGKVTLKQMNIRSFIFCP